MSPQRITSETASGEKFMWSCCRIMHSSAEIFFCMQPANEKRRYNVMSLTGWAHTQNGPCLKHFISVLVDGHIAYWLLDWLPTRRFTFKTYSIMNTVWSRNNMANLVFIIIWCWTVLQWEQIVSACTIDKIKWYRCSTGELGNHPCNTQQGPSWQAIRLDVYNKTQQKRTRNLIQWNGT